MGGATHRFARLIAVVAGIAGVLLCGLVPLLPVKQTTATILWPQASGPDGLITDITAPLVSGAPLALDVSIPCQAIATLPAAGGLVFSTVPPGGIDASRNGLFVRATADVVVVAFRDSVAAVAPRPAVESGACSTLHLWANLGEVGADFIGIPGAAGTLRPKRSRRSRASSPTWRWRRRRACRRASTSTPGSSPPRRPSSWPRWCSAWSA